MADEDRIVFEDSTPVENTPPATEVPQEPQEPEQTASLTTRNMIDAPISDCPPGYARDANGECRPIF